MTLSGKQKHVLDNLERVIPWPRKVNVVNNTRRFQLDGRDCTYQITTLGVKGLVRRLPNGQVVRIEGAV